MDQNAFAGHLARGRQDRPDDVHLHLHGRIGLAGLEGRMDGAGHGTVQDGRGPTAVDGAERVEETFRRLSLEDHPAFLGLNHVDVGRA